MAAPEKYITHIAVDQSSGNYQIVPLALTDGSYLLTPPTLSKDSKMVLTEDTQTLYVSDQSYAYKGKLSLTIGCVGAIVQTGLTKNEVFALTGNRYGQTYLTSDTNEYYRCGKTTTTADSTKWRNVTSAATTSLALPYQLTTEDAIYIRINLNQMYYSQLPRFCVQAGYDNTNGTTWITGFCRQQNQFEITACSYNGNNLLGIYQTTGNTNVYVFKLKKYASTYGAANDFNVAPVIYYNEYSGTPTIEFIGKNHADYNTVKAYNYVSVPAYGIKGTAIQQTLIPQANNTYNLGSSGYHWKNAYVNTLVSGSTSISVPDIATNIKVLSTTATTSLSTNSAEVIKGSGTISLHKISKTGKYSDLIDPPTLGTAAAKNFTTTVTAGNNDLVTSGAVQTALNSMAGPMRYMGTLGTNGTITALPTASADNTGHTYKVITAGTYSGQAAKVGDLFISTGSEWTWIPSGDEVDTDTWRPIKVDGNDFLGTPITGGHLNIVAGNNIQLTPSGNNLTIHATDTTYAAATTVTPGLMSAADKTKLDSIATGAEVNVNADWNAESGDAKILNKPNLHPVATSGDYNDLINKPQPIYWCTYGTTTGSDIAAAITAGKYVACKYDNTIYGNVALNSTENKYYLTALTGNYTCLAISCSVSGNTWAVNSVNYIKSLKLGTVECASSGVGQIATWGTYNASTNPVATKTDISNGTITIKQTGQSDQTFTLNGSATTITLVDTTYSNATTSSNGLMSATDKTKLDGINMPQVQRFI